MPPANNATSRTKDKENRGDAKITKVLDGGDAILEAQSCEGPCVTRAARWAPFLAFYRSCQNPGIAVPGVVLISGPRNWMPP